MVLFHRVALATCVFVCLGYLKTASASSFSLHDLPWHELEESEAFVDSDGRSKEINQELKDSKEWKGTLCNGRYSYNLKLRTLLEKTDIDLNEDGTVTATALFKDLSVAADGFYKSQKTLCVPLGGRLQVSADDARVKTKVTFVEKPNADPEIRLRILETKLGRMHFGGGLPSWLEQFLTGRINVALDRLWNSKLGDWVSDKISEFIKDKFPKGVRRVG